MKSLPYLLSETYSSDSPRLVIPKDGKSTMMLASYWLSAAFLLYLHFIDLP